jgi:hypothetical protein
MPAFLKPSGRSAAETAEALTIFNGAAFAGAWTSGSGMRVADFGATFFGVLLLAIFCPNFTALR